MGFAEKLVKETSEIALSCVPRARMVRKINHSFIPKTVGSRDRLRRLHCMSVIRRVTVFYILKKQNQQDILTSAKIYEFAFS